MNSDIEQLFEQYSASLAGKVWRGGHARRLGGNSQSILKTGYPALDKQLHQGGWPLKTITELGLTEPGIGELRLLMPALRELMHKRHSQQYVLWIAPPLLPFVPALRKEQIDTDKLIIVQTSNIQETLWATEQALLAECCAAVFSWTDRHNLRPRELRRLQLAAEQSGTQNSTWHVLFRHSDCLQQSSTSGLRLLLKSDTYSKLDIQILKQPQGWGGQYCSLSLHPHYQNWQRLPVSLLPQHNRPQIPLLPKKIKAQHHQAASVTLLGSFAGLQTVH